MTTRVDDSRSSLHGSYFELLYEKYPDLAPPARQGTTPRVKPSAAKTEQAATTSHRGFDSLWVPGLLMAVLALALAFPPALLWQPSWLGASPTLDGIVSTSIEGTPSVASTPAPVSLEAVAHEEGEPAVQTGAPGTNSRAEKLRSDREPSSSLVVADSSVDGDLLAIKERQLAALLAAERRAVEASTARRQAALAALPPVHVVSEGAETAQVSLVAESALPETVLPEVEEGDVVAETSAADFLEVAIAGPRIQPARRLQGEAPRVATVEQPTRLRLRNHINPEGDVVGVDILQGLSQEQDRQVADALRQWRYEPATVDGRAVSSQQEVVFVLMPDGATQLAQADPVEPARRRVTPLPGYTQEAWIQGTEGDVELLASIDARGEVTEVEVVSGLPHGLTQSAVQAVERWKFDPARQRGEAVASTQRLRLRFAL